MRIAVLVTCHNRVEKTLAFLRSLGRLSLPQDCKLEVYLNDDGSTDGTGERVKKEFPDVNVISGSGQDYWCGGMRRAWRYALKKGVRFDYFLWANDDVELFPCAIKELIAVATDTGLSPVGLVCGSFCDPDTGTFTYGGRDHKKMLEPDGIPHKCVYVHGNTVLIPWSTFEKVGMFDERWTHGLGDTDYGFMCIKNGMNCLTTGRYIGTCRQHKIKGPWFSSKVPLRQRWKLMWEPVGGNFREYVFLRRKHFPFRWPIDVMKFFVQVLFPKPFEMCRK